MKKYLFSLLWTTILICGGTVAQDLNIDFYTDEQVLQYWQRAQAQGYSISEVEQQAISNGMAPDQAKLLTQRILSLTSATSSRSDVGAIDEVTLRSNNLEQGLDIFLTGKEEDSDLTPYERRIFGYSIFQRDGLSFNPNFNMATPQAYIVGPGDELIVEVFGTSQQSYRLTITSEGRVMIPRLGPVRVGGLTIEVLKEKLEKELSQLYSGLRGTKPTVFIDLTLGNIRTIKVNVVGEITRPGVYALPSFISPFQVIFSAGGPTTSGSFRNIAHYRAGRLIQTIDLYDFLTQGKLESYLSVEENDIFVVPQYRSRIEVEGRVRRPGYYELSSSTSLIDVIQLAGGFEPDAYRRTVTLERLSGEDQLVQDVDPSNNTIQLQDGDKILVRKSVDPLIQKVQIEGAVLNPGPIGWAEDLTIKEVLNRAGGLLPEAHLKHVTLFSKKDDLSTEANSFDLSQGDNLNQKISIGDLLYIPSKYQLSETSFIEVKGEVTIPGVIPYFEKMTIADALILASGLKNAAIGGSVELIRRELGVMEAFTITDFKLEDSTLNFQRDLLETELLPFDQIFVRQSKDFDVKASVEIRGEIKAPGEYVILDRESTLAELITRSGGLDDNAYVGGIHILRRVEGAQRALDMREKLRKLQELRTYLSERLEGGTLSEVERRGISQQIGNLEGQYERELINSGVYLSDSLVDLALDSVSINVQFAYDKIPVEEIRDSDKSVVLQNGDIIMVPPFSQTVKIRGEVLQGASVSRFRKFKKFNSYIGNAGGYTSAAKKRKVYVVYANGSAQQTRSFLFFRNRPPIEPGSEIVVPGGRNPLNLGPVSQIFGILTGAASVITSFILVRDAIQN